MRIVALIPTTGKRDISKLVERLKYETDDIIIYHNNPPKGTLIARNELLNLAMQLKDQTDAFLMIDDDTEILEGNIKEAANLFERDHAVGIIGIKEYKELKEVFNCWNPFLIKSEIIEKFSFTTNFFDLLQYCLDVWLAGYKIFITDKCTAKYHTSKYQKLPDDYSILDNLFRTGSIDFDCNLERFENLFDWKTREYLGYKIPIEYTIYPTEEARSIHFRNNIKIRDGRN